MATNLPPPSVNSASNATTRFVQLRTEIEDKFTDLHQMLDIRRQQLLDKLTELEEMNDKYVKHTEAIKKLKFTIETIQQTFDDDLLADTLKSTLPVFQTKLENLEKENLKTINMEKLNLIYDKTVFKNSLDSISISDSKIAVVDKEIEYTNRKAPTIICAKSEFQHCINSISISDSKIAFQYSNRTAPILSKVNRGTNKGEISLSHGISIDDAVNEVYICDYNPYQASRIQVFSLDGEFIREFGKYNLKCPFSIALSSSDVFVTNSRESHCLMKFNNDGTFLKRAGSLGSGNGEFNWPQGLCVANASVFVCDFYNNRMQVFDFNLCYLFKFTSEGLTNPKAIKLFSNQLFVSKETGSIIFVYSLEGTYIKYIQLTGDGSPLKKAYFFTMDIEGNYLFSDYNSNCIKIFSPSGEHVASLGGDYLQNPKGLAVDKQGLIVCVCGKNHAVFQTY